MFKHVDEQYKDLVKYILEHGDKKNDRTGVGTISSFGHQLKIDMRQGFPLLTTKKVYWNGVLTELTMFLKGITDLKFLLDNNTDIWTRDAYKFFIKNTGNPGNLTLDEFREYARENGFDLGTIYGSQWVNFNGEGVNQLDFIVNEARTNPSSRRLKAYTANPAQFHNQTLPPCHDSWQINIVDGFIDLSYTMRSQDVFHGASFNIAFYASILCILGKMLNLTPRFLVSQLGDTHLYLSHLDVLKEQISRKPYPLPTLVLSDEVAKYKSLSDINPEHIKLENYVSHGKLTAPQAF